MITVKEYAQHLGISEAAAYKRLQRKKYAMYVVQDESGRKMINPAIFDHESASETVLPAFNPDSTKLGNRLPGFQPNVGSRLPEYPGNAGNELPEYSTNTGNAGNGLPGFTEKAGSNMEKPGNELPGFQEKTGSNIEKAGSTPPNYPGNAGNSELPGQSTEIAILRVKLEYAERETEHVKRQLEDARQQVDDMRSQLIAKDNQITELNERLRESHIIAHAAQQKPRFFLTGIIDRFKGHKAERNANAAGNDNQ